MDARTCDLGETQQMLIRRDNIYHDTIEQYKDAEAIKCKVLVKFDDEVGEDLQGLTKQFFSLFWKSFVSMHCHGSNQKLLNISLVAIVLCPDWDFSISAFMFRLIYEHTR